MATQNRVRRKIEDPIVGIYDFEVLVETGGIAFPDGRCIEIIKDSDGSLTLLDSKSKKFDQRIDLAGQQYVPPLLASSMLEALTLPTRRIDCGSTVEMFSHTYNLFLDYGVSEDVATASTYFVFASWFPECLSVAPCLIITGTEAAARIVLQILACLTRHALPLAQITLANFHCLPMHIQPTMLIAYVHPQLWRVFSASTHPRAYVPNKNGLTDLYCAKAAYAGPTLGEVCGDAILNVHCAPSVGKLSVMNVVTLEKIAADFQPKLLDYRLKHIKRVQDSDFDAPMLPTPLRMLARAMGSCIVDAPDIQAGIMGMLESRGEELRANRLLDPGCVAIEVLFAHCHEKNEPTRVGVSEIAAMTTAIMTDRGETMAIESKAIGSHLRRLGLRPKRDSKGFAIHLTADVRHFIHKLARDQEVGDSTQAVPDCSDCAEVFCAQTGGSSS